MERYKKMTPEEKVMCGGGCLMRWQSLKLVFAAFLLCLFSFLPIGGSQGAGQAPDIQWQKSFGGDCIDSARSIRQTADGGFIVAGESCSTDGDVKGNHGDSDWWVVKLSESGTIQWQKSLGGRYNDLTPSIQQTADGGYIVAGTSSSIDGDVKGNHGDVDFWVVKLSASGAIEWQKPLGGSNEDSAGSIQQTADGGYIVAGESYSTDGDVKGNHGYSDWWVVKLSASGTIQWQKSLGGSSYDSASSIQQTTDGGYIVVGISGSTDGSFGGESGLLVVKLSASGAIEWQKPFSESTINPGSDHPIQQTADGGYIVAGESWSRQRNYRGGFDFLALKLSASGAVEWQKSFGGNSNDYAHSIQQTADGGYVVAGESWSRQRNYRGGFDFLVVKLSASGAVEWQKSLGGSNDDLAHSIQQTADGGYIAAGGSDSTDGDISGNHGKFDFWIVKLGPGGSYQ
jgi:hypothetical protein